MATYERAFDALEAETTGAIKRAAWENKAIVLMRVLGTPYAYPIWIEGGRIDDDMGVIKRYFASDEDKAATDWVMSMSMAARLERIPDVTLN